MRSFWVVALAGLLLGAYFRPAYAETADAAVERLAAQAVAAYHDADYTHAIDLLKQAYQIRQVPALLYNLGKAYQKLGDPQESSAYYRRYIDCPDADPRLRAKARAELAILAPLMPPRPPPTARQPEAQPPAPQHLEAASAPAVPKRAPVVDRAHARRVDRDLAIVFGTIGLGAVGTAIGLSVNVLSLHGQYAATRVEDPKRSLRESAQTQALAADILYAAGGVSVALGGYFLYRALSGAAPKPSESPEQPPRKTTLFPWFGAAAAGVAAEGTF